MKTKRILSILLAAALVLSSLLLSSCSLIDKVTSDGTVTVVLAPSEDNLKEYTVSYKAEEITEGLVSVLALLKEDGKINYGINGTFLDYVKDSSDEAIHVGNDYTSGKYLWIYTSVESDYSIASMYDVEYDGKTLKSSDLGANQMTVEDGAVFYIGHIVWG